MSKSKSSIPLNKRLLSLFIPLSIGLLLAIVFKTFVITPIEIQNDYMMPTYKTGDTAYLFRFFRSKNLRIGDIVLSKSPFDSESFFLGRIVGKPGDTISISKRIVYRNGNPLDSQIFPMFDSKTIPLIPPQKTEYDEMEKLTVPDKSFFVLADNVEIGVDSRTLGTIPENLIVGKL